MKRNESKCAHQTMSLFGDTPKAKPQAINTTGKVDIFFDGGCLGNPGQKYGSFQVLLAGKQIAGRNRVDFGHGTNNEAAIVAAQSGDPLPNSPKNSATLALDYAHVAVPFSMVWTMRFHLDGNYRSATYSRLLSTIPGAPAPFLIDGFSMWNGSVGLVNKSGLSMSLYGQNLFNTLGITGGLDPGEAGPPPTNARAAHYFISRPRTIGLRLGYSF